MKKSEAKDEAMYFLGIINGVKEIPVGDDSLNLITSLFSHEKEKGLIVFNIKKLSKDLTLTVAFIDKYMENLLYWGILFPTVENNCYQLNPYFVEKENEFLEEGSKIDVSLISIDDVYSDEAKRFNGLLKEFEEVYKDYVRFTEEELVQGELEYQIGEVMAWNEKEMEDSIKMMEVSNEMAIFCENNIDKYGKQFQSQFFQIELKYKELLEDYIDTRESTQENLMRYDKTNNILSAIDCINGDTEVIKDFNMVTVERASSLRDLITKRHIVDCKDRDAMGRNFIVLFNKAVLDKKELRLELK